MIENKRWITCLEKILITFHRSEYGAGIRIKSLVRITMYEKESCICIYAQSDSDIW